MKAELAKYEVDPDGFWKMAQFSGGDGYDTMGVAERRKWHAVPVWGSRGWDLGSWPLVIVYVRNRPGSFDVAEYVEGDITCWSCPTEETRNAIIDELAFFHWKMTDKPWVENYNSLEELPDELKGPYRNR